MRPRKAPKPRDPTWRFRRALGHQTVTNRKRQAEKTACRHPVDVRDQGSPRPRSTDG